MFNVFTHRPSQILSILESGIDRMVAHRNAHLAEMNRLETVINAAQVAYNQHTRLYEALNNSLFAINHPFDAAALEARISDVFDADLSVDQPSDEEREAARIDYSKPPTPQELADAEPLDMPAIPPTVPIPFASRRARKATGNAAAE